MLHASVSSPVGPLHIDVETDALIRLDFDAEELSDFFTEQPLYSLLGKNTESSSEEERLLAKTVTELNEYFHGDRRSFTVPVRLYGTDFRRRAWSRLEAIPYGIVKTYGDIAAELGQPKASRAVGGACGSNPVAVIVPCHRVTGSNGKLTGFGGGLPRKAFLLELESRQLQLSIHSTGSDGPGNKSRIRHSA